MKLSVGELKEVMGELSDFRENSQGSQWRKLTEELPISYSDILFDIERGNPAWPCLLFGHQLVLHIVDALIDCEVVGWGGEGWT